MLQGPFLFLAILLLATIICPIWLPLAVLVGYPGLILIALRFAGQWLAGRLERPAGVAAVWAAYLGLILALHGIIIGFDTAMAGTPPTAEAKHFGARLAYLGGAIAVASAIAAYAMDVRRRAVSSRSAGAVPPRDPSD